MEELSEAGKRANMEYFYALYYKALREARKQCEKGNAIMSERLKKHPERN